MLEVRELLIKAFASAWREGEQSTDRDTYITSSINVINSIQIQPEMIYAEEGQGLVDGEQLDHLEDLVRADGVWVYYGVPAENFFLVTWMPDAEAAAQPTAFNRSKNRRIEKNCRHEALRTIGRKRRRRIGLTLKISSREPLPQRRAWPPKSTGC